jgi:hypothetical protein
MTEAVIDKDRREKNKMHQLWQGTFDVKECRTLKVHSSEINLYS